MGLLGDRVGLGSWLRTVSPSMSGRSGGMESSGVPLCWDMLDGALASCDRAGGGGPCDAECWVECWVDGECSWLLIDSRTSRVGVCAGVVETAREMGVGPSF